MWHWRKAAWVGLIAVLLAMGCRPAAITESGGGSIPATVGEVPRITPQEVKARLDSGEQVLFVDTRSGGEWAEAHIPNALSIPYGEIEARHGELPKDKTIVLYCT
jgi:predicted sulfurtransferase